jgi:hypothetical protein
VKSRFQAFAFKCSLYRYIEALLASIDSGGGATRAAVLDRWGQHTAICPDSRAAFNNIKAGLYTLNPVDPP